MKEEVEGGLKWSHAPSGALDRRGTQRGFLSRAPDGGVAAEVPAAAGLHVRASLAFERRSK
jgi:hypothetical protein